ncbi:MAG: hypothetical protein U9N84_15015 [Actinomycetota bacterium]|nr:hypothetical protein [Actinomycetota bacterium]
MTATFSATRSPVRQLLLTAAGVLLLLAALDIVSLHKLSGPPSADDAGLLTSKGQTERRTDLVWGTLFVVAGVAFVVVGAGGLLMGRPVIELEDEGMRLRVAGPMSTMFIPWTDVVSVRSGRDYDDDGRIPIPVLLVEVSDRAKYPDGLWGARWEGNTLEVDADSWEATVEDVVVRTELLLERPTRVAEQSSAIQEPEGQELEKQEAQDQEAQDQEIEDE